MVEGRHNGHGPEGRDTRSDPLRSNGNGQHELKGMPAQGIDFSTMPPLTAPTNGNGNGAVKDGTPGWFRQGWDKATDVGRALGGQLKDGATSVADDAAIGAKSVGDTAIGAGTKYADSVKKIPGNLLDEAAHIGRVVEEKWNDKFGDPEPPDYANIDPAKHGQAAEDYKRQRASAEATRNRVRGRITTAGIVSVVAIAGSQGVVRGAEWLTSSKDVNDTPAATAPAHPDLSGEGKIFTSEGASDAVGSKELVDCEKLNSLVITRTCETNDGKELRVTTTGGWYKEGEFSVLAEQGDDEFENDYKGPVGAEPVQIPVEGCNVYVSNPTGTKDNHRELRIQTDC